MATDFCPQTFNKLSLTALSRKGNEVTRWHGSHFRVCIINFKLLLMINDLMSEQTLKNVKMNSKSVTLPAYKNGRRLLSPNNNKQVIWQSTQTLKGRAVIVCWADMVRTFEFVLHFTEGAICGDSVTKPDYYYYYYTNGRKQMMSSKSHHEMNCEIPNTNANIAAYRSFPGSLLEPTFQIHGKSRHGYIKELNYKQLKPHSRRFLTFPFVQLERPNSACWARTCWKWLKFAGYAAIQWKKTADDNLLITNVEEGHN